MDKQEIFNAAYVGVISQGCAALEDISGIKECVYKTNDDVPKMCAAGHVMDYGGVPKESFLWEVNGSVKSLRAKDYDDELPWDISLDSFVLEVQDAHDSASVSLFIEDFDAKMQELAKLHGLDIPSIE